ncbi:MAG: hypothetical protein K1X78_09445 [Verrucomicrobiaceae bacterium]|nr:hypothetical protein [Verrucomicrobiaceae bacterium]
MKKQDEPAAPTQRKPAPATAAESSNLPDTLGYKTDTHRPSRIIKKTIVRLLIAFLVAALPLLGLLVKLGVNSARQWWSQTRAENAANDDSETDLHKRAQTIIGSLRQTPNDPKLLRTWASFLKENKGAPSDRVAALRQVAASDEATNDDRKELALAFIDATQFDEARPLIEALPPSLLATLEVREARAALLDASGDHKGATALRRDAWQSTADDARSRLNLALLDLNAVFEEKRVAAIETLWTLSDGADENALQAVRALARLPSLTPMRAETLQQRVQRLRSASNPDVFLVLSAVLRTHPQQKATILAGEVEKARSYSPADLAAFLTFLDEVHEWSFMLSLLPAEKAMLDRDLCVMRIKALSELGRFSELEAMLASRQKLPLSNGHLAVFRAFFHQKKGETDDALRQLSTALAHATADEDLETVRRIAGFAREQGFTDTAAKAFAWIAEHDRDFRLSALNDLFKIAVAKGDASLMLSTAERMVEMRKQNAPLLLNVAYLRLLVGSRIETVPELLTRLDARSRESDGHPTDASVALLQAFMSYRFGDASGVREALARIDDCSLLPPGQRAIAAALFQAYGSSASAFELASTLPALALLPEEKNLWINLTSR